MRRKIERFCNDIKVDYCLYLYEKGDSLNFPYCCKLSADLITSYLKMICSDKFQYICTTRVSLACRILWKLVLLCDIMVEIML